MRWETTGSRVEWAIDIAAAALLALAIGFAVHAAAADPELADSAAPIVFILALAGLRKIDAGEHHPAITAFQAAPGGHAEAIRSEIARLSAERPAPGAHQVPEAFEDSSNVLRFDRPGGYQTDGEDAGQALSDALANLRRSLR
ncbi:MAG: hypothetical protein ABI626_06320 [Sphingomicrobium sp.]